MSEQFVPSIKERIDVSGSVRKTEMLHASQAERIKILNEYIDGGAQGTIVTREGKNDLWIRKETQKGILKGVDAMKPGEDINVLKAEYKKDAADGKEKLYYFCEVQNTSTVHGGTSGTDKGWIYAGYIDMDMPVPIPPTPEPTPGPTPVPPPPGPTPGPTPVPPPPGPTPGPTPVPDLKGSTMDYFSKHDDDKVNVNIDADPVDKGTLEFSNGAALKEAVSKQIKDIDKDGELLKPFEDFSKKSSTYPLLWSILLAETGIHGANTNGVMTNIGRWLQRDPVYKAGVEKRIKKLLTEYQGLTTELQNAISSRNTVGIKGALQKLNNHLSPTTNQNLMDHLSNGLSEAKGLDELKHGNWIGDEALSQGKMDTWYKQFENGDAASVYEFTSDTLEARDVLTGSIMETVQDPWKTGTTFEKVVDMGTKNITKDNINSLINTSFEVMGQKVFMPGELGRGLLGTGTWKENYADSLNRLIKQADEQGLAREDKINYVRQMFMAEVLVQKEDEIISKLKQKAMSGKPEDAQNLRLAEQFFKNKSLLTEVGDNWKMYTLKAAAVYATMGVGSGFAGGVAEGLAARGVTTGLGRLGMTLQSGPIASRVYQIGTMQTSLAAGTAISQGDAGVFLDQMTSGKYWLEGAVMLTAFSGLQAGLNRLGTTVSNGLVASRTFTLSRDIIAGMGVMGVNEVAFNGQFTVEEIINTVLFAAAANMTRPKITKAKDGRIIIEPEPPVKPTPEPVKPIEPPVKPTKPGEIEWYHMKNMTAKNDLIKMNPELYQKPSLQELQARKIELEKYIVSNTDNPFLHYKEADLINTNKAIELKKMIINTDISIDGIEAQVKKSQKKTSPIDVNNTPMSFQERISFVKPGETIIFTEKTGDVNAVLVTKNTNGIIDGIIKGANGTDIPIRIALTKNGTSLFTIGKNGHDSHPISELAEMEVRPAGTQGIPQENTATRPIVPKPESPQPALEQSQQKPTITVTLKPQETISEVQTKLSSLQKLYDTLQTSGRDGPRDRAELMKLSDEIRLLKSQIQPVDQASSSVKKSESEGVKSATETPQTDSQKAEALLKSVKERQKNGQGYGGTVE